MNDQHKITGVENDDERPSLDQQQLIDFVRKLPISGEFIPRLEVSTVYAEEHEVDVIRIFNSENVPIFLGKKWNEKGLPGNLILPGQIFTERAGCKYRQRFNCRLPSSGKSCLKSIYDWTYQSRKGTSMF